MSDQKSQVGAKRGREESKHLAKDYDAGDDHITQNPRKVRLVYNKGSIQRYHRRIVVTGGAGFVGSHLIDRLMQDKRNRIICVDSCFSGSKSNIRQWIGHPRFEFIRHDVINPLFVECEQIYHLACPASPVFYQDNPIKTLKVSFMGTMNMLGLAKRSRARLLFSSTSEVYGDPEVHPQTEEYWGNVNPIGIRSCYDEGKRAAETLCFEYHRQHGVEIRVARIFNTYGPRMLANDGRVVSNFIVQALQGKQLTVYGEGKQTRSFCYVSDLVEGLIGLMNQNHTTGPVNLGNPGEYTIKELAGSVQTLVDRTAKLSYQEMPSDDPKRRKPVITKAKKYIGWEPKIPLLEGLKFTIADFYLRLLASGLLADKFKPMDDKQEAGKLHAHVARNVEYVEQRGLNYMLTCIRKDE